MALAVRNNALREMPPFMSSKKSVDILREKLILSDIEEIQLHGLRDFSLRKAATCCELSSLHAISTSEIKMTSSPQPHNTSMRNGSLSSKGRGRAAHDHVGVHPGHLRRLHPIPGRNPAFPFLHPSPQNASACDPRKPGKCASLGQS